MNLYSEGELSHFISSKQNEIITRIKKEEEDFILNVGEETYAKYLKEEYLLDCPIVNQENIFAETYEQEILGGQFPWDIPHFERGRYYTKDVFLYYVPFVGDLSLLRYRPSRYTSQIGHPVKIDNESNSIKVEIINFYNDPARINQAFENEMSCILSCYDFLKNDIDIYNQNLEQFIKSELSKRKLKLLKTNNLLYSLGVPVKKKSNINNSFSIPKPKLRKKISIKPIVDNTGFNPEPTLDNDTYFEILKVIHDVGKNFERMPSVYSDKKEEDLRDHILMTLDPNFELGSASGETFNKKGKTDIQLRYDSSVVFIAECKFWAGKISMLKTIDQLLNYLTWRDSKTAILFFVRTKEITSVLMTVKNKISTHSNYIKELNETDESWLNYIFSLPLDKNKEIKVAIQLFHIP